MTETTLGRTERLDLLDRADALLDQVEALLNEMLDNMKVPQSVAREYLREILTRDQPDVFGGAVCTVARRLPAPVTAGSAPGEYVAGYPDGGDGTITIFWHGLSTSVLVGEFEDPDEAVDRMLDLAPAARWRYERFGDGAI
ncbi:MAG: hypothetical protein JXB47_03085 [Anaerolineae bacterium]|nr:hypothetical protein [Anaerolineae bacterium]